MNSSANHRCVVFGLTLTMLCISFVSVIAQTAAPAGALKSLPAPPPVIPAPLLPSPVNAPADVTNAPKRLSPEAIGGLPQIWTYIATADLAVGANLRDVFVMHRLNNLEQAVSSKQVIVRALITPVNVGWTKLPDSLQDGQEMLLVRNNQSSELRLYERMSHCATVDMQSLRLVRGTGASWKSAAFSFKCSDSSFQVIAVERQATQFQRVPWPVVTLPSSSWLTATTPEAFQVTVQAQLFAQLRLRSALSPHRTLWRLGAAGLRNFAATYPQYAADVTAAQRVAVMNARGEMTSLPILDYAQLTTMVKNRLSRMLQAVIPQAAASSPITRDESGEAVVPKARSAPTGVSAPPTPAPSANSAGGTGGFGVTAKAGTPEAYRQAEEWVKNRASQMPSSGSRAVPLSKEDREAQIIQQVEAVTKLIPSDLSMTGRITLEMEVEPGEWWPIIEFTETQS